MKEQIENIVRNNVDSLAITEIEQLMCYREVRAFYMGYKNANHWEQQDMIVIARFEHDYPESMITAAIDRVKSEQK